MNFLHQYHKETQIIHNKKICFEPHIHEEAEIIAMFKGSAFLTIDGNDYMINEGDFVIVFPNSIHSYRADNPVDVGKFIFSHEAVPELKQIFESTKPKHPVVERDKADTANLSGVAKEILAFYQTSSTIVQKAYLLLLTGKLLELCEPEECRPVKYDTINSVFEYCKNNYHLKITQKDVADALFISKSYISHIFCCKLKINFCDYLNMLRINEACRLLSQSRKSVIEISEECGFSSLRSFNRAFLKHRGMTPKEYRNIIKSSTR